MYSKSASRYEERIKRERQREVKKEGGLKKEGKELRETYQDRKERRGTRN